MAAAAPARKAAAARKAAPARAPRRTAPTRRQPSRAQRLPSAVGRTAVAVGTLPDSGVVVRMTRGRAWIAVLGILLTGVVALNVVNLSLGASQGKYGEQAQIVRQENSALRARLAKKLSDGRVRNAAAGLGMAAPAGEDINYREASPEAVKTAVRRLAAG